MSETQNLNYQNGINVGLSGCYCIQVVDSTTDEIISDYGWHKNLILNSGMDAVASVALNIISQYAIAGTGSRPNYFTSSASTITQSANYIGLVNSSSIISFNQSASTNGTASYTSIVQVGDVIIDQFQSQSVVITSSLDGKTLQISGSGLTFSTPRTFTIWKTSQTSMQGENQRTSNYYPGFANTSSWNCGTVQSGSTLVMRRSYNFNPEVQSQSYTEVGTCWNSNTAVPIFSRYVLPQAVVLAPAQQLRLIYDLSVSYGQFGLITRSLNISGWPVGPSTNTLGTESIQNFNAPVIDANGNPNGSGIWGILSLDPSNQNEFFVFASTYTASFYTGSATTGLANALPFAESSPLSSVGSYVPGTYTNTKTGVLSIYQATSSNIMTIGFGTNVYNQFFNLVDNPWGNYGQCMIFAFNQPQTKTSFQTLTLTWRWNWSRVIQ